MITESELEELKRNGAEKALWIQLQNRLQRALLVMNPYEPNLFHGHRVEAARSLIDEAEALSLEIEKLTPRSKNGFAAPPPDHES